MGKSLVIVESPAKARTITKYLGRSFTVKASMGHVRDLPKGKFGIDVEHDFTPQYVTIRGKGKTLDELKKAARSADRIYLAPDPDREGEAIAWHLREALDLPEEKTLRVTFNEITKKAVNEAVAHAGKITMARVDAQQARRILDRIIGYRLSPLLWKKLSYGTSAGRVQSVAVRLVVAREREIREFVPEEFWRVNGRFRTERGDVFEAELKRVDGETADLPNEATAQAILDRVGLGPFEIAAIERQSKSTRPFPPFATSQLQQTASTRLRFSTKKTMQVAQQLYEGVDLGEEGPTGLITYMRTDSFRISNEALEQARAFIPQRFGKDYLPEKPNVFRARSKSTQDAHEAIRPTAVDRTPESVQHVLTRDQLRLYKLIWERFVASQMANARYDLTNIHLLKDGCEFRAHGRVMTFPGFTKVWGEENKKDQELPEVKEGERIPALEVTKTQFFTQPPARYTEASLVKALEKKGIGRPSTYASIISTVQERGYCKLEDRKFHATSLGEIVTDQLVEHFPHFINTEFTAQMEQLLDDIEEAKADWLGIVREFYERFEENLSVAEGAMRDFKTDPVLARDVLHKEVDCDACGAPMQLCFARSGGRQFLGCSNYPTCKSRMPVDGSGPRQPPEETEHECPDCGAKLLIRTRNKDGNKFLGCAAYPKCKFTCPMDKDGNPVKPIDVGVACEKCGSAMVLRRGRRGHFLGCSGFPKCRSTMQLPEELRARFGPSEEKEKKKPDDAESVA